MSVLRRMFSTGGSQIHLATFLVMSVVFIVVDLVQGRDSETNLATLDWAHLLIMIWMPIVVFHGITNLWSKARGDADMDTTESLRRFDYWI